MTSVDLTHQNIGESLRVLVIVENRWSRSRDFVYLRKTTWLIDRTFFFWWSVTFKRRFAFYRAYKHLEKWPYRPQWKSYLWCKYHVQRACSFIVSECQVSCRKNVNLCKKPDYQRHEIGMSKVSVPMTNNSLTWLNKQISIFVIHTLAMIG